MTGRLLVLGAALVFAQPPDAARDYERFMGRWTRALAPELIRFAQLSEPVKILDYGCATGGLALRLGARFPKAEVTGADPSEVFTAWATTQTPRTTVRFQTADLIKLPYRNGEFDATLSIGAMGTVSDAYRAIGELRRVTRPEGVVAAAVWDYGEGMQPLHLFWEAAAAVDPGLKPADSAETPFSKQGQLAALWKENNLRDVEEQALVVELGFGSFDDYWSPFLLGQGAAGAWLAAQPPEKRDAVRERLRARILGSRADGPFTLKARAWAVRGIARSAG
jgi:SAM-dependent methyltransferase